MEIAYIIDVILMSVAVSLGVGCSTVAIIQFFVAISDGTIDASERRLMGVVYILLRVAMVAILVTLLVQGGLFYSILKDFTFVTPFYLALWTAVAVLFINAIGMTLHWIPSSLGPAIQAGTWYTLGVLLALVPLGLIGFPYLQFVLAYLGILFLAIAVVNVVMNHLRGRG